jgi:hypothetical protein
MGVTLYETLTGTRPYDATSYGDLLLKVTDAKPRPVADIVPGLPRPLCDVIARAMATDPAKRFASMTDLARALEPFVAGVPSTPQLSWSAATQRTPLVSETPSVHELALSVGVERSPRRMLFWLGLVAALGTGFVVWRSYGDQESNIVRAGPPATSTSQSAATATPEPTTELPSAALPSEVVAPQPAAAEPNVEPENIAQPKSEPVEGVEAPSFDRRAARRRRLQAAAEEQAQQPEPEQRAVEAAPQPQKPRESKEARDKRKARAPAHMQRDDF